MGEGFDEGRWADALARTAMEAGPLRTEAELNHAARVMLSTLGDPFTQWLPPSRFRWGVQHPGRAEARYVERTRQGPGVVLGEVEEGGGRVVEAVLAESSAEQAGIVMGDRVLSIDGRMAAQMSPAEVQGALRGPLGSAVELRVASGEGPSSCTRDLVLERRRLGQPPVKAASVSLPGGGHVAYLRLHYFNANSTEGLQRALIESESSATPPVGYVLDLRNNPGGEFEEALRTAGLFLDCSRGQCGVVDTVRRGDAVDYRWRLDSLPTAVFPDPPRQQTTRPVAVLADRGTASSGEIVAGALRDHGRAVLLGERTFGKGLVQYYFPIGGRGAGAKVTIAKFLLPSGYDIAREGGLTPDVPCPAQLDAGKDVCLAEAVQWVARQAEPRYRA